MIKYNIYLGLTTREKKESYSFETAKDWLINQLNLFEIFENCTLLKATGIYFKTKEDSLIIEYLDFDNKLNMLDLNKFINKLKKWFNQDCILLTMQELQAGLF